MVPAPDFGPNPRGAFPFGAFDRTLMPGVTIAGTEGPPSHRGDTMDHVHMARPAPPAGGCPRRDVRQRGRVLTTRWWCSGRRRRPSASCRTRGFRRPTATRTWGSASRPSRPVLPPAGPGGSRSHPLGAASVRPGCGDPFGRREAAPAVGSVQLGGRRTASSMGDRQLPVRFSGLAGASGSPGHGGRRRRDRCRSEGGSRRLRRVLYGPVRRRAGTAGRLGVHGFVHQ